VRGKKEDTREGRMGERRGGKKGERQRYTVLNNLVARTEIFSGNFLYSILTVLYPLTHHTSKLSSIILSPFFIKTTRPLSLTFLKL
jgi:hypothetical protein